MRIAECGVRNLIHSKKIEQLEAELEQFREIVAELGGEKELNTAGLTANEKGLRGSFLCL